MLRTQLHDPHFFQKRCHFRWNQNNFCKNDNAFERNEDRVTGFLKWTNFRNIICFYFVVLLHCFFFYITLCESPFIVLVKTNLPFFRTRKCNSWAKKIKSELVWSEFLGNFEVMGDLIPIIEGPAKIRDGKKVRNTKVWFNYPQNCSQDCLQNCSWNCSRTVAQIVYEMSPRIVHEIVSKLSTKLCLKVSTKLSMKLPQKLSQKLSIVH